MAEYDSRPDTREHIEQVRRLLSAVVERILSRADRHDRSKLVEPELSVFDEFTPKLKATTYGSDEYKEFLGAMGSALSHHYAANSHHPEHYAEGIEGMDLIDLIEMLADWKAATLRHDDGDLNRSIEINQERFNYDDQLKAVLRNTADRMGWT